METNFFDDILTDGEIDEAKLTEKIKLSIEQFQNMCISMNIPCPDIKLEERSDSESGFNSAELKAMMGDNNGLFIDQKALIFLANFKNDFVVEVFKEAFVLSKSRRSVVLEMRDIQHYLASKYKIWTLGLDVKKFEPNRKPKKVYDLSKVRVAPIRSKLRFPPNPEKATK